LAGQAPANGDPHHVHPSTRCVGTVSALKRNYKLRDELSMNARA